MNSAKRGPAYGFKLPTFERMLDTKSTDRKQTLLHYVAHAVQQTYPQALEFIEEFEAMKVGPAGGERRLAGGERLMCACFFCLANGASRPRACRA